MMIGIDSLDFSAGPPSGPAVSMSSRRWWELSAVCWPFLLGILVSVSGAAEPKGQSEPVTPASIEGEVTAIVDGDTLYLSSADGVYVIDLAGIDAPEKGQPAGDMATQVLHLKVMKKRVQLLVFAGSPANPNVHRITPVPTNPGVFAGHESSRRLRGRLCGILYSDGCVNAELVREGIAWHNPREYPSKALAKAQETAKKLRRGLWQTEQMPIPPWEWRAQQAEAHPHELPPPSGQVDDLSRFFEAQTPQAVIEVPAGPEPVPATAQPSVSVSSPPQAVPSGDYWLTTSSGIRHNSKCRYFKTSKGRPCTGEEGRPCKKCGG